MEANFHRASLYAVPGSILASAISELAILYSGQRREGSQQNMFCILALLGCLGKSVFPGSGFEVRARLNNWLQCIGRMTTVSFCAVLHTEKVLSPKES